MIDLPLSLWHKIKKVCQRATNLKIRWRPQGDLNPCCRRERPVSWTGLDDGDVFGNFLIGGPCAARTRDSLLKRQILYQLS